MSQTNHYELKGRLLLAVDDTDQTVDLGPISIPLTVSFQKPGPNYRQGSNANHPEVLEQERQERARAAHLAGKGDQFRKKRGIDVDTADIPIVKAIDDLPEDAGNAISDFFGYDGKD